MQRSITALPPGCDPSSVVLTFPVAPEFAGLRLDTFLKTRIPRISRTKAKSIIESCAYRPDGRRRRASERVRAGETLLLVRQRLQEPETPQAFGILHADADVVAVDKPAGLPVHPTATYHRHTLTYLLRQHFGAQAPHIVHRLDRETSGIVLCARHLIAERFFKEEFARRRVEKRYLAIVRGEVSEAQGEIALPLEPASEGLHLLMQVAKQETSTTVAKTHYRVCARRGGYTMLLLAPHTGRQHQLRVHLAAIGHPIVGDKLYGPEGSAAFIEYIDTGMTPELEARLGHPRQALHAFELRIRQPQGQAHLCVRAGLPDDLRRLWKRLGKR